MTTKSYLSTVAIAICLAGMAILSGCGNRGDYAITYHCGTYSSGKDYTQAKNKGESVTLRGKTYTRNGFTQTGWSILEDGSTKDYNLKGTYTNDADITLYPFWKEGIIDPDDDDPPGDDKKYTLPTNVKFVKEQEAFGNLVTITAIKIGENYYWKKEVILEGKNTVTEFYLKHNNGSWTKYSQDNITPSTWYIYSSSTLNAGEKDTEVAFEILGFMEYSVSKIDGAVKGGQETIAGVLTDIYTTSNGTVLNYDPVTKLVFKSITPDVRNEVKSWDKSVTGFDGIDLP